MSDTNILPNDQNFVRAAGFESSSTAGLVMAGQIDEVTGRILVDNAGSSSITVANEATDTTCFLVFVTAATGSLEPKTNANLAFNSSTGVLTLGQTAVASISGNAGTVTFADEATDTTCFIAFATAASGSLAPKTNTNMTFNSSTGVATFASTVLTTTDINGGTIDGVTIGGASAGAGTFTTLGGTTITASAGFALGDGDYVGVTSNERFVFNTAGTIVVTGADLRLGETAGTDTTSVVSVGGTQTLTAKTLTSPAITTGTYTGTQLLAEGASIGLDPSLSADGTYTGTTITGTAGAALAFGDLIYLDPTDSRWELADANAAVGADGDARGTIGICVQAAAGDGSATTILLNGAVRADTAFPALTINAPVYVSETAGDIVVTQPTTTDVVIRVLGFALTADSIIFNPSSDYITHT